MRLRRRLGRGVGCGRCVGLGSDGRRVEQPRLVDALGVVADRVEQVRDASDPGQDGVRVGVEPGGEHERPLPRSRVRDGERVRVDPQVVDRDHVQVERAVAPADLTGAPVVVLDPVQGVEEFLRRQVGVDDDHAVAVPGLGVVESVERQGDGLHLVARRHRADARSRGDRLRSGPQGAPAVAEVRAEGDDRPAHSSSSATPSRRGCGGW